ncbi:MAG: type I restriction enzyme HsdR N-terminal domain-containing protein [Cyclobacteriaceae bacterium]
MDLNLPPFAHKVQKADGKARIFDIIRRKYVALTPEEWVRQHLIHYMVEYLDYPRSLISVESGLKYHKLAKRTDVVVFDRTMQPLLLAECKSFRVKLDDQVFHQSAIYNQSLKAPYIMITNGLEHHCCRMDYLQNSYVFIDELLPFEQLCSKK